MAPDPHMPVLVAEDDPNDVLLLTRSLHGASITNPVVIVGDGDEAIDYLSGSGVFANREAHPLPVVMLLDLKMPRRSGFEVLQWLRAQPRIRRLPVIVLTSSRESKDIKRAYALGANSYLVKPVPPERMVEVLREVGLSRLVPNEATEIS